MTTEPMEDPLNGIMTRKQYDKLCNMADKTFMNEGLEKIIEEAKFELEERGSDIWGNDDRILNFLSKYIRKASQASREEALGEAISKCKSDFPSCTDEHDFKLLIEGVEHAEKTIKERIESLRNPPAK